MMQNPMEVISGIPPIITNKKKLKSLKAFGGAEQSGTPSPEAPINIVCNNGILKARLKSGLPFGYTLLDYIEATGTQYINTGFIPDNINKTYQFKTSVSVTTFGSGTRYFIGIRQPVRFQPCGVSSKKFVFGFGGSWGYYSQAITANTWHSIDVTISNGSQKCNDTTFAFSTSTANTNPILLFGSYNSNTSQLSLVSGRMKTLEIYEDNVLIHKYIPAKDSNNVIGMYDTVDEQFLMNSGSGSFSTGDPISDPITVYADGTVETIQVCGKNLIDPNSERAISSTIHRWYDINGGFLLKANKTYTLSCNYSNVTLYVRNYDTKEQAFPYKVSPMVFTPQENIVVDFQAYRSTNSGGFPDDLLIQLELGSEATSYEPYNIIGEVTAEMLLKIGDYKDEHEIIGGGVMRNVGIKIFDGTESVIYFSTSGRIATEIPTMTSIRGQILCTHYPIATSSLDYYCHHDADNQYLYFYNKDCSSADDYKDFFSAQYAVGTPVIVIYPLATPTTESVSGQTLTLANTTSTIDISQASLGNLELEIKVK